MNFNLVSTAMDADNTAPRGAAQAAGPSSGGSVEPTNRATAGRHPSKSPPDSEGMRYEMRDPFAEVTYRTTKLSEITAKADQLGSTRFTAIGADGKRSTVTKVDGEWQHEPPINANKRQSKEDPPTKQRASSPESDATKRNGNEAVSAGAARVQSEAASERAARVAQLEAALMERYIIKRAPVTVGNITVGETEYRFRGDTSRVAFTESKFRLATETNSPSVARSMVDVAEARNWRALRVSGSEDFKRMVWLEASARDVRTTGYEPNPADLEALRKAREARQLNRVEPSRSDESLAESPPATKSSSRGGGGRKAVLAAIDAVLVAKGVSQVRREAVLSAATEQLAQRSRAGQAPKVRIFDRAAPSDGLVAAPSREAQRTRESTTQTR